MLNYIENNILFFLIVTPLFFILVLLTLKLFDNFFYSLKNKWDQQITMIGLLITFAISIYIWILFDKSSEFYQFTYIFDISRNNNISLELGLMVFFFFNFSNFFNAFII